jgi:hypothetical protein
MSSASSKVLRERPDEAAMLTLRSLMTLSTGIASMQESVSRSPGRRQLRFCSLIPKSLLTFNRPETSIIRL